MTKTIRLIAPDWQAGNQPVYYRGAQLLSWLIPSNPDQPEITLPITQPTSTPLTKTNGVTAQAAVKHNVSLAQAALDREQPDRVITLGGNCLVSQAPFDYLHQKYGHDLGVIWIDAHPDISTPKMFHNEHAMVLGNLLGHGDPELAQLVHAHFHADDILYVGLQTPTPEERPLLKTLGLNYQLQTQATLDLTAIQNWISTHHFTRLAVHLDLDVLDPQTFKSLYFTEPGVADFPAEAGKVTPSEVARLLTTLTTASQVVGLTVAEYLPWDVMTLQDMLSHADIFN